MKILRLIVILLAAAGFNSGSVFAQLVGGNAFLQGAFVETGIAPNGSWGAGAAPAGYHGSNITMIFDYSYDGWAVGTPPMFGDYVYPGTPFEGWSVQVGGNRSDMFYSSGASSFDGPGGLTGSNTAYYYTPGSTTCGYPNPGGSVTAVWQGTMAPSGLAIRQYTTIDTAASWVTVNTVFVNPTATTLTGLYYHRTSDPDNDQTLSGDFNTNNVITHQDDADHRVMVGSYGTHDFGTPATKAYLALGTKDCRAKCLIYQAWPPAAGVGNNLDLIYDGTATGISTTYYGLNTVTVAQDIAIGLIYKLGDLAAGDSTMISYAYILKDSLAIDSVFREPQLVVNCVPKAPSGPAPAPTYDTFYVCANPTVNPIPVYVKYGGEKNWSWSKWTWAPATGLLATTGLSNTITVGALSGPTTYTITGTNTGTGMPNCAQRVFYLTVFPCHSAISNSPGTGVGPGSGIGVPAPTSLNSICEGDTLHLIDKGDSLGATYLWYGPGPTIAGAPFSTLQNPIKYPATMADTGWYHSIKTQGGASDTVHCHVLIRHRPLITATFNPPVCGGDVLHLYSNPDYTGETWSWTGPLGFTSTVSDPSLTPADTMMTGDYKVVVSLNGCTDSSTIHAVVLDTPVAPSLSSNSPVCEEDTMKLFATTVTAGVTWSWTGPGGFTSTLQNPFMYIDSATLPPGVPSSSGTYSVTVRRGVCVSTSTTVVEIRDKPDIILGSNSPVCSGNALNLTTTAPPGSTCDWMSGPLGFTSTLQYPSINPAFTAHTGTYSVAVTLAGCTSDTMGITAVVDSTPEVPVLTTNSPGPPGYTICQDDTLTFTANSGTGAGVIYNWTGPNSFATTVQNPFIMHATPLASGIYTVVAALGTCSSAATISATVTPTPPITITSNSPVCSGGKDTLKLFATGNPGSVFSWTGPYTFFSNAQNPFRTPVSTEYAGLYYATVLLDGCTNVASVPMVVNPTPTAPWVKWVTYCQYYDAPPLQAIGSNLLWYTSSAPGSAGSPVPPKPSTDVVGIKFYFVNQTVKSCPGAVDSIRVRVDPTPTVTVSPDVTVCPWDSVAMTAVNTDAIAYYHWIPSMYLNDTSAASVIARPETNTNYMVISTNVYGCSDTAKVSLTVKEAAVINLPDSVLVFPGETYQVQPSTNCSWFSWTPSGGLNGKYLSNPIASPEVSTKYVVTGITEWGCKTKDSININLNDESVFTVPNAFAPGSANSTFKVIRRGNGTLRHFRVYDRWGVMVFQTSNIDEGWDGTFKGVPQSVGVYIYDISAASVTGKVFNKTGNVTLLR